MNLDRAAAWQRLRDLSAPHLYVPGLTGAAFSGPRRVGVGTRRKQDKRATRGSGSS